MNGPQAIGLNGIRAWSELTGTIIRPDEVEILRQMDAAYRSAMATESKEAAEREG